MTEELNQKYIDEIKPLWENYLKNKGLNEKELKLKKEIDESWLFYKNRITNSEFTLYEYTNKVDLVSKDSDIKKYGSYLCSFLENSTYKIYGASKPGTALNFGIKLNDDCKTYYINGDNPEKNASKEEAEKIFDEKIKPSLKELIDEQEIDKFLNKIRDYKGIIKAKQILRKIAVLNFKDQMLSIYKDEVIDDIYSKIFKVDFEISNLEKNYSIAKTLTKEFEINELKDENLIILSRFLWDLFNFNPKNIFNDKSKNIILYGSPGTGKTYSVINSLSMIIGPDRERYKFIQFHPSYTYEDFIEGIKPKGINSGTINLELCNGEFKSFCKKAYNDPNNDYFFIIDEINRANLSSVFGEILYCLEYRYSKEDSIPKGLVRTKYSSLIDQLEEIKREELSVHYDKIKKESYFCIPNNMYFVGMMNDVDKSIDSFDLALRRRFKWIRYSCNYNVIEEELLNNNFEEENIKKYLRCCEKLNTFISNDDDKSLNLGKSYEFGHSFFMKIIEITKEKIQEKDLDTLFETHLRGTLKEYLRAYYSENEIESKHGKLSEALNTFKENIK